MVIRFGYVFAGVTLAALLAGLLTFLLPDRIYACSCLPLGTPLEELEETPGAFMGKVSSISIIEDEPYDYAWHEFKVTTVWKGPLAETIFIKTQPRGMCGTGFAEGKEYVVYSIGWDNGCSRSRPVSAAAEDLAELGQGHKPIPGTILNPPEIWFVEKKEGAPTASAPAQTPEVTTEAPISAMPTPTTPAPSPTPTPSSGGCGISPDRTDLSIASLIVGIVGLSLGRRRFNAP